MQTQLQQNTPTIRPQPGLPIINVAPPPPDYTLPQLQRTTPEQPAHPAPAPTEYTHHQTTPEQPAHPAPAPTEYTHHQTTPEQPAHPAPAPTEYTHHQTTPEQPAHPAPAPTEYTHHQTTPEQPARPAPAPTEYTHHQTPQPELCNVQYYASTSKAVTQVHSQQVVLNQWNAPLEWNGGMKLQWNGHILAIFRMGGLSGISGMEQWNGIVEWNTGILRSLLFQKITMPMECTSNHQSKLFSQCYNCSLKKVFWNHFLTHLPTLSSCVALSLPWLNSSK